MPRKRYEVELLLGLALTFPGLGLRAEVRLPALISDGMVLQQGTKVKLWGTANPGERVTVNLDNQQVSGVADDNGRWNLYLGPLNAGGPFTLAITGKNTITLHEVLIGEVWVCSGQSNMSMTVGPAHPPYFTGVNNYQEELRGANYPLLHLFTVGTAMASKPQRDFIGHWVAARPETVNDFSAVGYFFGRDLLKNLDVPVGIIHASLGSTTAETWTPRSTIESDPAFEPILAGEKQLLASYPDAFRKFEMQYAHWKEDSQEAESAGRPIPPIPQFPADPRQNPNRPAALYNGMIAPMVGYSIKGVAWYQGESNADRPAQYEKLFPALIHSWRRAWGQGDFPFLFVQLASWGIRYPQLHFPELREAQAKALSLPNTAMAVTTDIGDGMDGHPKNKQDVGYRLALAAQAIAYGRDEIYMGPTYASMLVDGDTIKLRFEHVYGRLTSRNWPPGTQTGFEVAGDDKRFFPAQAQIEGETVVVHSENVLHPVAVRFNWDNNPWYNLYNLVGLPASPFRTDNWADEDAP